jgi:hypothetical protein
MQQSVIDALRGMGAYSDAVEWVSQQKTVMQAWRDCDRADRMMWLLSKTVNPQSAKHKRLVLLACRMAEDALRAHWRLEDQTPFETLRIVRLWADDKATLEEVLAAGLAAWEAAGTALSAGLAPGTVWAAGAAAEAAEAAGTLWAAGAAGAARVAWSACAARVAWAGWAKQPAKLRLYADWVREEFPRPPRIGSRHGKRIDTTNHGMSELSPHTSAYGAQ